MKEEFNFNNKDWYEKYAEKEKRATERAVENIQRWIEEGQELIFPERYAEWEECVKAHALDLYHGAELDSALEIMQALKNDTPMKEVKKIFKQQGHSGASSFLVREIILLFSNRGPEFWKATAIGKISAKDMTILKEKEQENMQLAQAHTKKDTDKHLHR